MHLPGGDTAHRFADHLHALDFTVEGVRRLLGDAAADALDSGDAVPAQRALASAGRDRLATLIDVFLLARRVPSAELAAALPEPVEQYAELLRRTDGEIESALELAPYATDDHDWWVASDWSSQRTGRPTAPDHVLGVGGASTMLAQCTVRPSVERALDLGTGCGVQALHLAQHSATVVATDVSARCLEIAAMNADLAGASVDLHLGSWYEPVGDDTFDLIVSNPPFVIGSPDAARHDYRDSGLSGDAACAQVVTGAAARLNPGGWCQLLANWLVTDGSDWAARPRSWVEATGLDAWVIQRDVQDPAAYVRTWLRDAGEHRSARYAELYDAWLTALERDGVLGVGFGVITLHRPHDPGAGPFVRCQHVPQAWVQPVASDIERWMVTGRRLAERPADVLLMPLTLAPDVVVETHGLGSAEPLHLLRRTTGMAWTGPIDPVGLAVLEQVAAAAAAPRPLHEVLSAVAAEQGVDLQALLAQAVPVLGQLVAEGFLTGSFPGSVTGPDPGVRHAASVTPV